MSAWDTFLALPGESTLFTVGAHAYAKGCALETFDNPRFASDGTELRILNDADDPQYVVSVLGQPAAQGGKQGADPRRIEYLHDEVPLPVLMVFIQGIGREGATTVWSGWLTQLGPARPISLDPAAKRYGWLCRDLGTERALVFPQAIPLPPPGALF